jgi:ribose transport system ATP-binding protein
MYEPFLELRGIGKTYPGVIALSDVSLSVSRAEVVGLIGENGAGKSTLMKTLGGVIAPTTGTIVIDGVERSSLTVNESMAAGIAFVHQELNLFDNLDVAANIFIGREPRAAKPLRLIDRAELRRRVEPLLKRLNVDFSPDTPVADLSIAQQQMVEIAKALSINARLIIMDEPTSSLAQSETERLLQVIAELRASGVSIIYISHRMGEIKRCADRIVCLRDGRLVGGLAREDITHAAMIRLMIGRDLRSLYIPPRTTPDGGGCEIHDLRTTTYPTKTVSLNIRRGEILGLAGLIGAGRTEMARTVFGIDPVQGGEIRLDGKPVRIASPRDAIRHGIYLAPEDRKRSGLVLDMPISQNVTLASLPWYARWGLVNTAKETESAEKQHKSLRIKAPSVDVAAITLSGGNQQKIVLGKWLSMRPQIIIFDEPTRGIDVGAKGEIYELMRGLADNGVAVLMISSDMEEVIGVSDRIAVMHEGGISGFLERNQFSEQNVLQLAIGNPVAA